MFFFHTALAAFLLLCCATISDAHTWVEQVTVIASNGTFVGTPGYPRGFVPRAPDVDPDAGMVYLLPPNGRSTGNEILPTDLMCKSSQTIENQTPGSPALIASPGDLVALRYQENGHVTQPQLPSGKPLGSGNVYVYGTSKPLNNDTYLGIHRVWNSAGTGGDGRGILLATRHFDDGQCYQINGGPISQARQKQFPHTANALMGNDLWCQTDVQLPTNATDSYTLYWVWEWPTLDTTGAVFKNESYTTCMDVTLDSISGSSTKAASVNFVQGQALDNGAIAEQLASPFIVAEIAPEQTASGVTGAPTPISTPAAVTPTQPNTNPLLATSQASSKAAGGFITVTVTATPGKETIYLTTTVSAGAGEPTNLSKSTVTVLPVPATPSKNSATTVPASSSKASAVSASTPAPSPIATSATPDSSAPPAVVPFLAPDSSVIQGSPSPTSPASLKRSRDRSRLQHRRATQTQR